MYKHTHTPQHSIPGGHAYTRNEYTRTLFLIRHASDL